MPTVEGAMVNAAALLALIVSPLQAQQPRPGNFTASATGPHTVVLQWTAAAGATRYWVQRAAGTANFANLATPKITGTTYTDLGAPPGTPLRYRAIAGFSSGPNTYSDNISVTTPTSPGSVASTSGSPPPGQPTMAVAAPPSATGTRLLPLAAPGRLAGAPTVAAVAGTRLTPAVAPSGPGPQNLRITARGPSSHTLTWDSLAGVSGYLVAFRSTAAAPFQTVTPEPGRFEIFGQETFVAPGSQYRVTALYLDGRRGTTDVVYANPPQPETPADFTAKQSSPGVVMLSWRPVPFARAYRVFGTGQPEEGLLVDGTWTYFHDLPDGSYSWQVTADYGGVYTGTGLPTANVILATPKATETPNATGPKRLSVQTFGGGGVQDWSWSAVPIASNYKLLRAVAKDSPTCMIPALAPTCGVFAGVEGLYYRPDRLSARDRSATIGETYLYKVLAYIGVVPIGESPVVWIKIQPRPRGVTNLTATWRESAAGGWLVAIKWNPAFSAQYYMIGRAVNAGPMESMKSVSGTDTLKLGGGASAYYDTSVEHGATYRYRITTYLPTGDNAQDSVTVRVGP